jgi:hypothetical protein
MASTGRRHRLHYGNECVMRIEGIIDSGALAYALFAIFRSFDVEQFLVQLDCTIMASFIAKGPFSPGTTNSPICLSSLASLLFDDILLLSKRIAGLYPSQQDSTTR